MNLRFGSLVAVLCGGAAAIGQPPQLESIQEFDSLQLNRLIWTRRAVRDRQVQTTVESSRPESTFDHGNFEPLPFVPEGCRARIALAMLCASDENHSNDCAAFKSLAPAPVRYLTDWETRSLYFGYSFVLGHPISKEPEIKADRLRNILIRRADDARKAIREIIDKHPGWEQYHVGYFTGGTLAYLLGQWAVIYCSRAERGLNLINDNNLVKVVTFKELPIFPRYFRGDVVGNLNHLAILLGGQPTESEDPLKVFGTIRHVTEGQQGTYGRPFTVNQLAEYSPRQTALETLKLLSKDGRGSFLNFVREHLYSVQQIARQLPKLIAEQGQRIRRTPYERCARNVGQHLATFLPLPRGLETVCTVDIPRADTPFKIQCSITVKFEGAGQTSTVPIVSYTAQLADFDEKNRKCGGINPLRTTATASSYPRPLPDWEACIKDMSVGNELLTLLSPYSPVGDGNCRFFADERATKDWATHPSGCVASPDLAAGTLRDLYQTAPDLFLQLIPLQAEMPPSCQRVIRPVQLPLAQGAKARDKFVQLRLYLKQMHSASGPLALPSRRVPAPNQPLKVPPRPSLFTEHDTPSFQTTSLKIGPGRFVADQQVAAELIQCLEKEPLAIINCNYKTNQLLGACPDFCSFPQSPKDVSSFCNAMVFCESIQAFVGFASQGFSLYRKYHAIEQTMRLLDSSEIFQYAFWSYRLKSAGMLGKLFNVEHGAVFFVRRPNLMAELKTSRQLSTRQASPLYPDDDSCLTLPEEPKSEVELTETLEDKYTTGSPIGKISEPPDQERPDEEGDKPINQVVDSGQVADSIKVDEAGKMADPAQVTDSIKVDEAGKMADPAQVTDSMKVDETGKMADPAQVTDFINVDEPAKAADPAQVNKSAEKTTTAIKLNKETLAPTSPQSELQTV